MPAVIRIPVDILAQLIDLPEGVVMQEARIIDDHLELLAAGVYRDEDGTHRIEEGWFTATYREGAPGVLIFAQLVRIPDDD